MFSLQNCCFNETYLSVYKQLLKNRKQAGLLLRAGEFRLAAAVPLEQQKHEAPDWPDHADIDKVVQESLELHAYSQPYHCLFKPYEDINSQAL